MKRSTTDSKLGHGSSSRATATTGMKQTEALALPASTAKVTLVALARTGALLGHAASGTAASHSLVRGKQQHQHSSPLSTAPINVDVGFAAVGSGSQSAIGSDQGVGNEGAYSQRPIMRRARQEDANGSDAAPSSNSTKSLPTSSSMPQQRHLLRQKILPVSISLPSKVGAPRSSEMSTAVAIAFAGSDAKSTGRALAGSSTTLAPSSHSWNDRSFCAASVAMPPRSRSQLLGLTAPDGDNPTATPLIGGDPGPSPPPSAGELLKSMSHADKHKTLAAGLSRSSTRSFTATDGKTFIEQASPVSARPQPNKRSPNVRDGADVNQNKEDDEEEERGGEDAKGNKAQQVGQRRRQRRRYDDVVRIYRCNHIGCTKAYGTLHHLNYHVQLQGHGPKRYPAEFHELRRWVKELKSHSQDGKKDVGGVASQLESLPVEQRMIIEALAAKLQPCVEDQNSSTASVATASMATSLGHATPQRVSPPYQEQSASHVIPVQRSMLAASEYVTHPQTHATSFFGVASQSMSSYPVSRAYNMQTAPYQNQYAPGTEMRTAASTGSLLPAWHLLDQTTHTGWPPYTVAQPQPITSTSTSLLRNIKRYPPVHIPPVYSSAVLKPEMVSAPWTSPRARSQPSLYGFASSSMHPFQGRINDGCDNTDTKSFKGRY